jgi:hypothetical protein
MHVPPSPPVRTRYIDECFTNARSLHTNHQSRRGMLKCAKWMCECVIYWARYSSRSRCPEFESPVLHSSVLFRLQFILQKTRQFNYVYPASTSADYWSRELISISLSCCSLIVVFLFALCLPLSVIPLYSCSVSSF